MSEKEIAFRVTGRVSFDYQIIVQAEDFEEAAYFASDIDLDKWIESGSSLTTDHSRLNRWLHSSSAMRSCEDITQRSLILRIKT